jgi:copper transport protein
MSRLRLGVLVAAAALALAPAAGAHAFLVGSQPADGSDLRAGPRTVELTFSEAVSSRFRTVQLLDAHGRAIPGVRLRGGSPATVAAVLPSGLRRGAYTLVWHVVAEDDGHATSGTVLFGVRTAVAPHATATDPPPAPLDVVLRWLRFTLLALLVGGLAFTELVLRSARPWIDPEVVGSARARTLRVATAAGVALLVVLAATLARQAAVVDGSVVQLLRSTRWGLLWLVQFDLTALLVAAGLHLTHTRGGGRALAAAAASAAVGVTAAEALMSHAAALPDARTAVAVETVHYLAAALWLGGVTALAIAVWPHRGTGIAAAVRVPFALLAGTSAVVVATSGLYLAGVQVASVDALLVTVYGWTVLAKIVLAGLAGALGALNFTLLRRRIVSRAVLVESGVGLAALLAAGVLTAAAPARGPQFDPPRAVVPMTVSRQLADLTATLTIRPNRPGMNTFALVVASSRRPAPAPVTAVDIRLRDAAPAVLHPLRGRGWFGTLPLATAGATQARLVLRRAGGTLAAPFTWRTDRRDPARAVSVSSRRLAPYANAGALAVLLAAVLGLALAAARDLHPAVVKET